MKNFFLLFLVIFSTATAAQDSARFEDLRRQMSDERSIKAIAESKAQLENLRREIERVKSQLQITESARNDVSYALRRSNRAREQLNKEISALNAQKNTILRSANAIARKMQQGEKNYQAAKAQLGEIIRAQYLAGEPNYLAVVLKGESPNNAARLHFYWKTLSVAHADKIARIKEEIQKQENLARDLDKEKANLSSLEKNLLEKEKALKAEDRDRLELFSRLKKEVSSHKKTIAQLQKDEKNLGKLLQELQKVVSAPKSAPAAPAAPAGAGVKFAKGALIWPLKGKIEGKFGTKKAEGTNWQGVFINAKVGTPVLATAAGQVVFADWLRGFGMLVIVDHGGSYLSIYGHNDEILKSVGDKVQQGDVLAYSGQNAENLKSGVYFEIRHQGKPMDPFLWIKK